MPKKQRKKDFNLWDLIKRLRGKRKQKAKKLLEIEE